MSTLNVHNANAVDNRSASSSEHIDRTWAMLLRRQYHRLRREGVDRSTARTVVFTSYLAGVNAAREETHQRRLAEIRSAA